jgi:hypothetical protein
VRLCSRCSTRKGHVSVQRTHLLIKTPSATLLPLGIPVSALFTNCLRLITELSSEQVSQTKERQQSHGTATPVNLCAPPSYGTTLALKALWHTMKPSSRHKASDYAMEPSREVKMHAKLLHGPLAFQYRRTSLLSNSGG